MKAGPWGPTDYKYNTAGKITRLRHAATDFGGHGIMASLDGNAELLLWFDVPPVPPKVGTPALEIMGLATVAAGFPEEAQLKVEWERIAKGGTWTSLSAAADEWTKQGATDEYYHDDTLVEPVAVRIAGMPRARGTFASLAAGEWDWTNAHTGGYNSIVVRDPAGSGDPDATKTSNTYIEYVLGGDTFVPGLNDEGSFTMVLGRSAGDANKGHAVSVPLDASTILGGDKLKVQVTFLTAGWSVNVLSAWDIGFGYI